MDLSCNPDAVSILGSGEGLMWRIEALSFAVVECKRPRIYQVNKIIKSCRSGTPHFYVNLNF
jgi:hypothetical protein